MRLVFEGELRAAYALATGSKTTCPTYGPGTILRSPIVTLPAVASGEETWVKYSAWFDTEDNQDYRAPLVSADLGKTWKTIPGSLSMMAWNKVWTQVSANLKSFAGMTVLFGFLFVSTTCCRCNNHDGGGWFIGGIRM